MNNTDDISFWDYPLPFQLFVKFILICTAITAFIDSFISDVIYLLIGYKINLYIAHFVLYYSVYYTIRNNACRHYISGNSKCRLFQIFMTDA